MVREKKHVQKDEILWTRSSHRRTSSATFLGHVGDVQVLPFQLPVQLYVQDRLAQPGDWVFVLHWEFFHFYSFSLLFVQAFSHFLFVSALELELLIKPLDRVLYRFQAFPL